MGAHWRYAWRRGVPTTSPEVSSSNGSPEAFALRSMKILVTSLLSTGTRHHCDRQSQVTYKESENPLITPEVCQKYDMLNAWK